MLLVTIFVELRMVAGGGRTWAGSPQAISQWCAVLWPSEEQHGQSMAWAWHGKCELDMAALCKSNVKDMYGSQKIRFPILLPPNNFT